MLLLLIHLQWFTALLYGSDFLTLRFFNFLYRFPVCTQNSHVPFLHSKLCMKLEVDGRCELCWWKWKCRADHWLSYSLSLSLSNSSPSHQDSCSQARRNREADRRCIEAEDQSPRQPGEEASSWALGKPVVVCVCFGTYQDSSDFVKCTIYEKCVLSIV